MISIILLLLSLDHKHTESTNHKLLTGCIQSWLQLDLILVVHKFSIWFHSYIADQLILPAKHMNRVIGRENENRNS